MLSSYDLYVPKAQYEAQISKCNVLIEKIDAANRSSEKPGGETTDEKAEREKRKKEKEKHTKTIEKLKDELQKQEANHKTVMSVLKAEKDTWLAGQVTNRGASVPKFLELCLFPRCAMTSLDAVYCAKFVHMLYTLNTPYFNFIHFYNEV